MPVNVLFEDVHLIVLDKPAGLLSQGEQSGDENVVDWLRERWGRPYVGLVHRLDRNTSGLLVVAKRTKAAQRLTQQLQDGRLEREYLAWMLGTINAPARWEHWLVKDERQNLVRAFSRQPAGGKKAVLSLSPRGRAKWFQLELTLVELRLETGRSHQIRAQASAEGHPLLGDRKYARKETPADSFRFPRPALHSHRLRFAHPMSGETLTFEVPLPEDMSSVGKPYTASHT